MWQYVMVVSFIVADVVSGLAKALYFGKINSTILRKGLFHKAGEGMLIGVSIGLEYIEGYFNIPVDIPVFGLVGTYIVIMELISILENIGEISPQLKSFLKPFISKLNKEKDDQENEK